jgi:hypothetical protein
MCLLIDIAVSSDRCVIQKKDEKKSKYRNLKSEIQRMLNMKYVISVIVGETKIVTRGLQKYL